VGAGASRANGTLFSPMDSKKRPSVPQRKQILAGGAFGVVKREPALDGAEVHTSCTPLLRPTRSWVGAAVREPLPPPERWNVASV
jgi:hypothetical protein